MKRSIRAATYNIHKCRGMDGRVSPPRIVQVLREIDAEVVALQEVLAGQAQFIAEELEMRHVIGETRKHQGDVYGNVVLSRHPVESICHYDLSFGRREERGCLRADVHLTPGTTLHVFSVHLGTAFFERRHQGRKLVAEVLHKANGFTGPRLVMGDFNEWTRGLASRLLAEHLESIDIKTHLARTRTYPGVLPFWHLDHMYYEQPLELAGLTLHKTRGALLASDHLPLIATFRLPPAIASPKLLAPESAAGS